MPTMDLKWYERLPLVPAPLKFVLIVYAIWLIILFVKQDSLIFYPKLAGPAPASPPYAGAEKLTRSHDGGEVYAYFIPGASSPAPLVVLWHGNAELIDDQAFLVEGYRARGFAVLLPEYRGYGAAAGRPSQTGIVSDSLALIDQALQPPAVDPQRVLYHGRSLGGAVAAQVALAKPPRALILQSAPANIARMAHGYGAPAWLVRHPFATDAALARIEAPLLVIHGRRDAVIPFAQGRHLADLVPGTRLVDLPCGHNDLPPPGLEEDYWQSVDGFLEAAKLGTKL